MQVLPARSYFDIIISDVNNLQVTPQPIYYSEARNIPYLYSPEKYDLSVVRWTCDTSTIPIWRAQLSPGSTSATTTIYSVTLVYGAQVQQVYVEYDSQAVHLATPLPPSETYNGLQDNSTNYYDVYNYQYVIYLFNIALQSAFDKLNSPPSQYAPVMTFDTVQNIAVINCDVVGYDISNPDSIQIFFNPASAVMFSSFPFLLMNKISTTGQNYQLQVNIFTDATQTYWPPVVGGGVSQYVVYQVFQESSTITAWNPVLGIVMCSNSLPIVPNNISGTVKLGKAGSSTNATGNNATTNQIVTDFVSDTGIYRSMIVYTPSAEYRRMTMLNSGGALTNLDISLYWRDRTGMLNPLLLAAGSSVTIKLLFELHDRN